MFNYHILCYPWKRTFVTNANPSEEKLELTTSIFLKYLGLMGTWWWIMLVCITPPITIVIILKNDDGGLSTGKAVLLTLVGLADLTYILRPLLPTRQWIDFLTRWAVLGMHSFRSLVFTLFLLSIFFAPFFLAFVLLGRIADLIAETEFAYDVHRYGIVHATKKRFANM